MFRCIFFVVIIGTTSVAADPALSGSDLNLTTTRSQIGWGASMSPDRFSVTSEGGWNGADQRMAVSVDVEAALVARVSAFASTSYGGLDTNPRPAIGAAYQLVDPRHGPNGVRVSLAYK